MAEFDGFGDKALPFFKALAFHQNKAWFDENRSLYESDVLLPLRALMNDVTAELRKRQINLTGDPRRGIFRLNRDVRFSNDKSPYKTHAGAVLTRNGAKNDPGLVYLHVDPAGCFMASGFYHPDSAQLRELRTFIRDKPERFRALMAHLKKHRLTLDDTDSLTRLPRDFGDVTAADLGAAIRLKSFVVRKPFDDKLLYDRKLVAVLCDFVAIVDPLIAWGRGETLGS
ncbi:TIGR02453 family protein [Candidatus Raskinella chloraquaticus]|uniref:TIGR02453 family protein n=1 Tax=Candidatus Raskinella chloraquaticus TaxID=1951219 RepID=A0A1W9HS67_9HYPH|nr:MAG: hypothetical protein A4S15_01280 [Proteobacteria bacterium SG_bin8]